MDHIYLLKDSNSMRTPGSHIARVFNQTFNLQITICVFGDIILFIALIYLYIIQFYMLI